MATQKELFELAKKVIVNEAYSLSTEDQAAIVALFDKYINRTSSKSAAAGIFDSTVYKYLRDNAQEPISNKALAQALEVSSQKMSAALRRMVSAGRVIRIEPATAKGVPLFTVAAFEDAEE